MQKEYNYYTDVYGNRHKYMMNSDQDTPLSGEEMSKDIDYQMHECSMYECKFIFSGCNRKYKKPLHKKDNRKCIEYKHKNL